MLNKCRSVTRRIIMKFDQKFSNQGKCEIADAYVSVIYSLLGSSGFRQPFGLPNYTRLFFFVYCLLLLFFSFVGCRSFSTSFSHLILDLPILCLPSCILSNIFSTSCTFLHFPCCTTDLCNLLNIFVSTYSGFLYPSVSYGGLR